MRIIYGAVLILLVGCSSTIKRVPSGRQGLFDKWSEANNGKPADMNMDQDKLGKKLETEEINSIPTTGLATGAWIWPLKEVHYTSHFGKRRRGFHEGVDLKAQVGTPVFAAQSGEVIYSQSKIGGYGNMIVIQHPAGLFSVYAHLDSMKVKEGQKVERGMQIAVSGKTGRIRGPHLHFEVRRGAIALNPESFYKRSEFFGTVAKTTDKKRILASARATKSKKRRRL